MAILRKDLLLELRTLETVPAMALLAVITFVIFHFGAQPGHGLAASSRPGC